ncbi:MAG: hypothetical protein IJG06_04830 [Clostridia bacterium]|nr:hypothetical protein [Clostridia bacterium]
MKKHYGKITASYARAAFISAALLIVGGIAFTMTLNLYVGIAEIVAGLAVFVTVLILNHTRHEAINGYLDILTKTSGSMSSNLISILPVPSAVCHIDGTIRWYNELFSGIFGGIDLSETKIENVISDMKWGMVLKTPDSYQRQITIDGRNYTLLASVMKNKHISGAADEDKISVYVFLIDKTTETQLKSIYDNERTDIAIINIDNYDDVLQRVNDNEQQQILSHIRR